MKTNKTFFIVIGVCIVIAIFVASIGSYYLYKSLSKNKTQINNQNTNQNTNQDKDQNNKKTTKNYPYTLVSYKGQVFGAKVPKGWKIQDNESGIDIIDPKDSKTGVSGAVAVGWFGYQTPDGFIDFMLQAIKATNVKYLNSSDEESVKDPVYGLKWAMKTKTFTFTNSKNQKIKAKASAGVLNGYGQFMGMIIAFQTSPEKWSKWAPTLERIAKSITIINPQKAGGIDKVRLPTAADLANDSSPLMESWEYRNQSQDRTSHNWSDAIMGQESDLVSPSTGQNYTLPLNDYDPALGGYRNPDNTSEILKDTYE